MKHKRLAYAGLLLIGVGVILFVYFQNNAEGASDPVELMRRVGQIAGGLAGLGAGLIVLAFFIGPPRRR